MKFFYFTNSFKVLALLLFTCFCTISCKKDVVDTGTVKQKPKVGTVWTYRYYTYYGWPPPGGGLATSEIVKYKVKSEDLIAGEKWLNIVDTKNDSTIYLLQEKPDGLYRYINNKSYLFCKNPAAVNETYTCYTPNVSIGIPSTPASEKQFIVKAVKETLPTGIGDIPANYYEGSLASNNRLINQVWFNEYAWIVREQQYIYYVGLAGEVYYRYSSLYLDDLVY